MNSGTSTVGATSSPTVPLGSVYSGSSATAASSPLTPPSNSGISTVGAASSPAVPIASVYSGSSVTAASSPLTPPVNSGTSWIAGSSPLKPFVSLVPTTDTGKLCILSIAPASIALTF